MCKRRASEWNKADEGCCPFGGSAVVGVLRGVRRRYRAASRRAARTRGFAAPALAGCAFVEEWVRN